MLLLKALNALRLAGVMSHCNEAGGVLRRLTQACSTGGGRRPGSPSVAWDRSFMAFPRASVDSGALPFVIRAGFQDYLRLGPSRGGGAPWSMTLLETGGGEPGDCFPRRGPSEVAPAFHCPKCVGIGSIAEDFRREV